MTKYTSILFLAIGHGLSDGTAGYWLGTNFTKYSAVEIGSAVLIYNILAYLLNRIQGVENLRKKYFVK